MSEFEREKLLLGADALDILRRAHVAVFGVGGVGGACVEALARAGVGELSLFDADTVSLSNINRQLIALHSTVGEKKAAVAARRAKDINPSLIVHTHDVFYSEENADDFPLDGYDFVVDAIDTVKSKLLLIERAYAAGTPILCSMGTGNKLDPTRFRISLIEDTSVCPLARVIRAECKKRGIKRLPVLWSDEVPLKITADAEMGRHPPGSISFVPPVAGFILAGEVVKRLIGKISA